MRVALIAPIEAPPLTTTRPGKGASRGTALTAAGRRVVEHLLEVRQLFDRLVHARDNADDRRVKGLSARTERWTA